MEQIISEYYTRDIGMEEVMESYVIILFTELLRTWRDETKKQASVAKEVQILELLSYIEKITKPVHCRKWERLLECMAIILPPF